MKPYRSIFKENTFKESGEYNDPETRKFVSNMVDMGLNGKTLSNMIEIVIWVEASDSNPEFDRSGYVPDHRYLSDLSNYLASNKLSKIDRRLLYNAYDELTGIEGFYDDNDLDSSYILEDLYKLEEVFTDVF